SSLTSRAYRPARRRQVPDFGAMTADAAAPHAAAADVDHAADALVHLSAAGVSVLLDCAGGQLPAIVHWGPALGRLTEQDARALVLARDQAVANDTVDVPTRLSLLPAQHAGWLGRPGISGSRGGIAWSPKLVVADLALDGQGSHGYVVAGAGSVLARASDVEAGLDLELTVEVLSTGLL